jgi:hypothetical protein
MKRPHIPYDLDICFCSSFIMATSITDFNGFFELFGTFSLLVRIISFSLGAMTGAIWTVETAITLRKIHMEETVKWNAKEEVKELLEAGAIQDRRKNENG